MKNREQHCKDKYTYLEAQESQHGQRVGFQSFAQAQLVGLQQMLVAVPSSLEPLRNRGRSS
jgi:hypothetical protein